MEIIWSKPAIQDLKDFKQYTKMFNPNNYIANLVHNVNLLSDQPHLGKIYLYLHGHIIRQLVHEQHRIFYYEDNSENAIHILSVIHHRQHIKEKFKYIQNYFEEKQ